MSQFYFAGDSGSVSSFDDDETLPFPEALPRSDFLNPDFAAPAYLSSLSGRHQTLEDLRSDLRERSQALSNELMDLVNKNYEEFLGLGSDLKGGVEKVEDVRVGLLGFKRGVEDVRSKVRERGREVELLLERKRALAQRIGTARKLLEFEARLAELEEKLMVLSSARNGTEQVDEIWSDSEDDDEVPAAVDVTVGVGSTAGKLRQSIQNFQHIRDLSTDIGIRHPFIVAQEPRVTRVRETLLLDLAVVLKQVYAAQTPVKTQAVELLSLYENLGEVTEALKILKNMKS